VPSRIVLIDHHVLLRAGLKALFASAPDLDLQVVAEAGRASEAYRVFDGADFDVIVLGLMLPGSSGLTILNEAKRRRLPQPRVVLSAHTDVDVVAQAVAAGANAYVSKDQGPEVLFEALSKVANGETFLPLSVPVAELRQLPRSSQVHSPIARLSRREREVFELLIQGFSNTRVAAELFISRKTVESHRGHILGKLGVHSICDLMRFASRHKLLLLTDSGI
jgi:DNA-binding NarL/FixJ family response regulator